jgi:hypothetical protein
VAFLMASKDVTTSLLSSLKHCRDLRKVCGSSVTRERAG